MLTRCYLKENQLLTVPFDKGIGAYVISQTYNEKMKKIIDLPQFQKEVELTRKNAKNLVLKEE